ncbi:MAG: HD domain-containing protein [Fimbriimonadaceae bacterium]|nr:HD domain-containing protein [Fimbriimonadaceae bacterium]
MERRIEEAVAIAREARTRLFESAGDVPDSLAWCRRHTSVADNLLAKLFGFMQESHPDLPPLALVATGGYGRTELCPFSDIDLALVPLEEGSPELSEAVRWLFRTTSDAIHQGLGLKVGYSYRLVSDVPGYDATILSGIFDGRLVAGSPEALESLLAAVYRGLPTADFILSKIRERRRDMAKTHETPLVVEPDLKFGAGGLRSFLTANWIAVALGERQAPPTESYAAVLRARILLHLATGRLFDAFTRVRAGDVAERTGVPPREFASSLAEAMVANHQTYLTTLDRLLEERYRLNDAVVAVRGEAKVVPGSSAGKAAFGLHLATKLGLTVSELTTAAEPGAGPEALAAVSGGEATVRNLDRAGLLQILLPELTACRTMAPDDPSHQYTVFEHTLRALRRLEATPPDSPLGIIKAGIDEDGPLHLAILLHDVGKADPSRPHSLVGAEVARAVGARWSLEPRITDLVAWLVQEHLTMSRFIRLRDVMHPDTALEFAKVVGDRERLDCLTLLTFVDMASVNESLWSPVQETFLLELHARTAQALAAESGVRPDETAARRRILRHLQAEEVPRERLAAFLDSLPPHYVLSTAPAMVNQHFWAAEASAGGEPQVLWDDLVDLGVTDVSVVCADRPGLLQAILAVLYAFDLSLVGLRASTTSVVPPTAVDMFTVSSGGRAVGRHVAASVQAALNAVLSGAKSPEEVLRGRGKDPERRQEFLTVSYVDSSPGIIEVRAPRGRGMPYRVCRTISRQGWNVLAARVGQWAGSGTAAFYVEGADAEAVARAFTPQGV